MQSAAFFTSKRALGTGVTMTVMTIVKIVRHQMKSRVVDTSVSSAYLYCAIRPQCTDVVTPQCTGVVTYSTNDSKQ